MYKIKQIPSDFIVREINKLNFDENGIYSYYLLKKTDYNTVDAINRVCSYLNISEKRVNFAGNKDKAAVTEQYISINHGQNKSFALNDIELKFVGRGSERLNLGCLKGNEFEIVVRNIEKKPLPKKLIINYFDEQRFGKNNDNQTVGKLILKERYSDACKMIPETERTLKEKPNDFVNALRNIPKKVLKLYIHAYQSYLWNIAAYEISKTKKTNIKLSIIGFGTEFSDKKIEKIYEKIMKDENLTFRDFVNKKIPELSDEGTERDLYVMPEHLDIGTLEDDELNPGMKKIKIKFSLGKGAYATNVIKSLME
jgi:tRNA pseudouridine13 synthase